MKTQRIFSLEGRNRKAGIFLFIKYNIIKYMVNLTDTDLNIFKGRCVDLKIALGSDHGGFNLKEEIINWLKEHNYSFEDYGTFSTESCDYPDIALTVAHAVSSGECDKGILVCGTGIGVSIAANKVPGIRAALCHDTFSARASREHNDANVLTLGERVIGRGLALEIVATWLTGSFAGGRHQRRVDKIMALEQKQGQ